MEANGSATPKGAGSNLTVQIEEELVLRINDVPYLLVDQGSSSPIETSLVNEKQRPFTVFPVCRGDIITDSYLQTFRSLYLDPDDIFQPVFLHTVIFYGCDEADVGLKSSAIYLLTAWHTKEWRFVKQVVEDDGYAPGPYLVLQDKVYEPWRVYNDDNLAMMLTLKPSGNTRSRGPLVELNNTLTANQLQVVVPSRSYTNSQKRADKPLLGVRIAGKDIFDIEGFKTSLCNRAWIEYHAPKSETAPCLKRLQDLGAIIVGKTHLNAMVVREESMECVEFLAPFNPRGDGYQTPSGSSTGSCVALAAYPWIDFTLGSDKSFFDVPTFFGRDISRFREFASLWYGDSARLGKPENFIKDPPKILYPTDYLPTPNESQMQPITSFIEDLERYLGVKKTDISLASMWRDSAPESVRGVELSDYLETAGTLPYYKDACAILKPFVDGYKERFNKTPFFHRALRWRWDLAEKVTPRERDEGWERIYTYKKWLLANVFSERAILVLPIDEGKPNNRENTPPPFSVLSGYHPLYLSPISGAAEVTAPSTDLDLIDLVHGVLKEGKKPVEVATGQSIFKI